MRINKEKYFMEIAKLVKERSTCLRRKVGAVLVKDNHIISTGYNGAPSKIKHCKETGCYRKENKIKSGKKPEFCRAVHAEINCIIQCAIHGTAIEGETKIYCTNFPCISCLKAIINAKIKELIYIKGYYMENNIKKQLIKESKLTIKKYKEK